MNLLRRLAVVIAGSAAAVSVAQADFIALYDDSRARNYVAFDGLHHDDYVLGFEFTISWEPANYAFDFSGGSPVAAAGGWEVFQYEAIARPCDIVPFGTCLDSVRVVGRQTSAVTGLQRERQRSLILGDSPAGGMNPFPGVLPLFGGFVVGRWDEDGSYDNAVQIPNALFTNAFVYGEDNQVLFSVPEPGAVALFAIGLAMLGLARRRTAQRLRLRPSARRIAGRTARKRPPV